MIDDFQYRLREIGCETRRQLTLNEAGELVSIKIDIVGRLA